MDTLEMSVWAVAEGRATPDDLARRDASPDAWQRAVDRLVDETEERLDVVRRLIGDERDQVVGDFEDDLARLQSIGGVSLRRPSLSTADGDEDSDEDVAVVPAEVRLQASWDDDHIVVWAGGPGVTPATNDELADRLEAIGGPALGWSLHAPVPLPSGARAEALAIPVKESLGWLVSMGVGVGADGVGPSVVWLGRVALLGARLVARGSVVPTLHTERNDGKTVTASVRWTAALLDDAEIAELTAAMPGPVVAIAPADARQTTLAVLGAVVHAVVSEAARKTVLPAPPPVTNTAPAVGEAFATRLDGSSFRAPVAATGPVSRRLEQWARTVVNPKRPRLVVQLEPPDRSDAWFLSVLGPGATGKLLPIEVALSDSRATRPLADELTRLERLLPVLHRPGGLRRGQVVLSQAEAWELMTTTGPELEAAGFEVRVPALSRQKPAPSLRLFSEPIGESVVGANQLSNVRWSVVFDDVELTAADIARLATEARPLVKARGKWIELDRVDLKEAAAALAERASKTQLTGAEILRYGMGLEGATLGGGITVAGTGWATELFERAKTASTAPVTTPPGFVGELRAYQAEALAWLGFLEVAGLGGCLALDMGLGKTPTVLAHLAAKLHEGDGAGIALVIAPPAVVGNWAAEAARFTPGLRVVVHHGASRATADELDEELAGADLVITTYGTALRDLDELEGRDWSHLILDEAQAIKNPANESSQSLRRIKAGMRVALTGTPIENGLGDLWALLDFTNPGLVGSRPAFLAQMAGEGESALRALNGILVFRRTKSEPVVAAELPDRIDELDRCTMTPEQIGLYQAVLDNLVRETSAGSGADSGGSGDGPKQGAILAAITALKQICNHPAAYQDDGRPLAGRSGKLARLEEIVESVFDAGERILVFTHFAEWGRKLAAHLTEVTGIPITCYDGSLARGARDRIVEEFQNGSGPGALVLSLKAGGTGLNLTAASHVVLYDRWWNPAVEDQARDRAWRIGQTRTVVSHRLVCPGTVDERVEEVVAGKRHIADLVLPRSSSLADLNAEQLRLALGLKPESLLTEDQS
jgi:superfamily II DNA or RNA helicase